MSGFGKTTIFNGLLGNRPNVFCWASDYLIWSSFGRPNKILVTFGDRPFQALQLYCYTPEIFLFSTATFKYTYRAPSDELDKISQRMWLSENFSH
jgi:hypothetical protein